MTATAALVIRLSTQIKPVRLIDSRGERPIPHSEALRLATIRQYKFNGGSGRVRWMEEIIAPAPAWQACYSTTGAAIRHFQHDGNR